MIVYVPWQGLRFEVVKEKTMTHRGLETGSRDNCRGFLKKMANFEVNSTNKISFMPVIAPIKRRGKIVTTLSCVHFHWPISSICWFLREKTVLHLAVFKGTTRNCPYALLAPIWKDIEIDIGQFFFIIDVIALFCWIAIDLRRKKMCFWAVFLE